MTIRDIAAKTGYSVGTVSRALNDHPNVSEKARKIILEAAMESGFMPNVTAKQLKQQRSSTILVMVKGLQNELFSELMEEIQYFIAQTPYQLVMDYEDEDINEVRRGAQLCRETKPLGILFLGGNTQNFVSDYHSIDVPCVLVTGDASKLNLQNLSSVSADDFEAGRAAVETLIRMGHRDIAIIGGDREISDSSRLRYEGCLQALREHGIDFDPQRDFEGGKYTYLDGYRATHALLARGRQYTAVFAVADVIAIGAIRAMWERGLKVPDDISIIGMDGLRLSEYMVPQLATIRQPVRHMAQRSVEILLAAINRQAEATHELIPFTVKCRESVRAIER